jgi:Tfp pilus assembly protein PilX
MRRRKSAGQALVLVTVSLSLIFGLLGLAVDLGWCSYRREAAQAAADAAALAATQAVAASSPSTFTCGTGNLWCGSPAGTVTNCPSTAPTTMTTAFNNACAMAAQNGFVTSGRQQVSIQANVTTSAPTVPGTTVSYWVTARVSEAPLRFFGTLIGSALNFTVRSSAAIQGGGGAGGCLYVLDPHAQDAFNANNDAQVTAGCGVYVNSDGKAVVPTKEAMLITGSAKVSVGSASINVNGSELENNGGSHGGTLNQNIGTPFADPLVNLPTPTPGTCLPASAGSMTSWQASPYTPSAGTYCSGFSLGNGMGAVMGPGIYIINGGTFSIQSGPLTASGGVMIFLTNGATVNIANGTTVTLSAMTTGSYQGILFYSDRSYSPGSSTVAGGANMTLSGSLYFPTSTLIFNNGTTTSGTKMAIVADQVNFAGGAAMSAATGPSDTGIWAGKSTVLTIE